MHKKQGFPAVKGRNGDPCMFTDRLHTAPVQEIIPEYQKDKPQGIRGIRHKGAGKQGMGTATGAALVTLYSYFVSGRSPAHPFHQVTCIGCKRGQTGFCMTDRTDTICMLQAFCLLCQPLSIGKRYLIQLAKNSKWSYHWYG